MKNKIEQKMNLYNLNRTRTHPKPAKWPPQTSPITTTCSKLICRRMSCSMFSIVIQAFLRHRYSQTAFDIFQFAK